MTEAKYEESWVLSSSGDKFHEKLSLDSRVEGLVTDFYENFCTVCKVHDFGNYGPSTIRIDTPEVDPKLGALINLKNGQKTIFTFLFAGDTLTAVIKDDMSIESMMRTGSIWEPLVALELKEDYQGIVEPIREIFRDRLLPPGTHRFNLKFE